MAVWSYTLSISAKTVRTNDLFFLCFIDLFSPTEFTPEVLQNFNVPILLIHTKFDESNGISLLNNSKSTSMSSNQSLSSNSLLPNYNRKSTLANLFNCDEIFIVKKKLDFYSNERFTFLELLFQ